MLHKNTERKIAGGKIFEAIAEEYSCN